MLQADKSINERKLNRLFSGVEIKDNGEIATDEKGNVKYNASKDKFNYGKYVDAIMEASERNAKLDWAVGDTNSVKFHNATLKNQHLMSNGYALFQVNKFPLHEHSMGLQSLVHQHQVR